MVLFPFTVGAIRTLKDRTVSIVLNTQELSPEKVGQLFALQNKLGFAALKSEEFTDDEAHALDEVDMDLSMGKSKSRSQRLRNTLYVLWKKTESGQTKWDDFYIRHMETIIDHFKTKIPDTE